MNRKFNIFLIKIFTISAIIVSSFTIWENLINAIKNNSINELTNNNSLNFKKLDNSDIWKISVAITSNIWIKYNKKNNIPVTIYKNIFSINEILSNKKYSNKELIWINMINIEEYKNILKTDIIQLLNSSNERYRILNAFIEQLEFRYNIWIKAEKLLNQQKQVFIKKIDSINYQINTLKQKIEKDFNENNAQESLLNIEKYLELKKEFYYARTYIIYINHFLKDYVYLNIYNTKIITILNSNKEALIKNVHITIPNSWAWLLKKFNLIYDEN